MKAFVINLERRIDRLNYINSHYKSKLFETIIFKAYDGHHHNNNSLEYNKFKQDFLYTINNNKLKTSFYKYNSFSEFKPGELGCFLSHLMIWKKIIDENINMCIIMEDDCIFNENYFEKLESIINYEIPDDFNIIYLGGRQCKNYQADDIKISDNIAIKSYLQPFGTFAYIISLKGTKILYDYVFNEFRGKLGLDYFIEDFFRHNNHCMHIVSPSICYSITNNNKDQIFCSDIQI